ncbi:hypothetical protein PsorP6_009431 [Peronosclerospora sorghi]|uniref:Uncharacterized protein n=1 Tax=Peronosclerospora sorghi TaxID=230839 RepID=A0ACC0W1C6_9STRA|nr:hypothetical protein PsorP6_009431 [Peronosclerospora sorghi]
MRLDAEEGDTNLKGAESSSFSEPSHASLVDKHVEHDEATSTEHDLIERGRGRYERVELGSLAECLARARKVDIEEEQPEGLQNEPCVKLESMSHVREIYLQENVYHEQKTIASDQLLAREKVLLLDQDPANPSDEKYKYSIAQLLEIQQCAPSDCPESLLASPVRNDASALNKRNMSRPKCGQSLC